MIYSIVSGYAKKELVQIETMTYKDRYKMNWSLTVDKKEKNPLFAFLIISANTHLAHLQVTQANTQSKPSKEPNFAFTLFNKCSSFRIINKLTGINSKHYD